ncbi:hypothetical protein [Agromyces soli]|uniref:Uncharacterized protein n=1 Tax=Agromyces soli TaxID=659012 RepID=A0ABY4AWE9_9MICO|nr:hypothetical protein [Agromyces soli]UOE27521.1 hypothetical protein MTP13_07015 [Agromyces soli]
MVKELRIEEGAAAADVVTRAPGNDMEGMAMSAVFGDEHAWDACRKQIEAVVDTGAHFPQWPFRVDAGQVAVFEYSIVLSDVIVPVLESLVDQYEDEEVLMLGLDPDLAYYREFFGFAPGMRLAADSVGRGYRKGLSWEPNGKAIGALMFSLNAFALAGSSGSWGFFAQRDWDIAILMTAEDRGDWSTSGPKWFAPDIELDEIRPPAGWGMPLSDLDKAAFANAIQDHTR